MTRLEVHEYLVNLLGSKNVYFQPPANKKIEYPGIIYALSRVDSRYANNSRYVTNTAYTVTLVDKDPESVIFDRILKEPLMRFDRSYTADNLHHWVFTLYTNYKEELNHG